MKRFQKHYFLKNIKYSWPVLFALAILIFFMGRATLSAYLRSRVATQAYLDIKQKREELSHKHAALEKKLRYLSSSYGLEKELREQFGVKRPDEEVIIIVDRPPPESEDFTAKQASLWQTVYQMIKKITSFSK
ncbi:hypothetical protein IIA95_03550 [Patescibacteria group bacterium]|nr:hypothetical protein [Patescibacteria group bacterium]